MKLQPELREVVRHTGMTQTKLSQITGIPQGRISEYVTGKRSPSNGTLTLLLGAMGFRPVLQIEPEPMGRSELRSWMLHRQLSTHLDQLDSWRDKLHSNLDRIEHSITGEPHRSNIQRWRSLISHRDVKGLRQVMVDPSRDGQEMREVGPFAGLLPEAERLQVMKMLAKS